MCPCGRKCMGFFLKINADTAAQLNSYWSMKRAKNVNFRIMVRINYLCADVETTIEGL